MRDPPGDVGRQRGDLLLDVQTQASVADHLERPRLVRLLLHQCGEGTHGQRRVLRNLEPAHPDDRVRGGVGGPAGDGGVEPGGRGHRARVPLPHLLRVGGIEDDHPRGPLHERPVDPLVEPPREPPERLGRRAQQPAFLGVDAVDERAAEQQAHEQSVVHPVDLHGRCAGDARAVPQEAGDEPRGVRQEALRSAGVDPGDGKEPHVAAAALQPLPPAEWDRSGVGRFAAARDVDADERQRLSGWRVVQDPAHAGVDAADGHFLTRVVLLDDEAVDPAGRTGRWTRRCLGVRASLPPRPDHACSSPRTGATAGTSLSLPPSRTLRYRAAYPSRSRRRARSDRRATLTSCRTRRKPSCWLARCRRYRHAG